MASNCVSELGEPSRVNDIVLDQEGLLNSCPRIDSCPDASQWTRIEGPAKGMEVYKGKWPSSLAEHLQEDLEVLSYLHSVDLIIRIVPVAKHHEYLYFILASP